MNYLNGSLECKTIAVFTQTKREKTVLLHCNKTTFTTVNKTVNKKTQQVQAEVKIVCL